MFHWITFDVRPLLPPQWKSEVREVAHRAAVRRTLTPTSVTSREGNEVTALPVLTVGGRAVRDLLPWLYGLYQDDFRELAQSVYREHVVLASDIRISINLNVQAGDDMRYECHVDTNPIEGLLYLTSHPQGFGGELVVANRSNATSVAEVDEDCSIVYPQAGHLIFFDARKHPHYVRPLSAPDDVRIVAAMNFYTPSQPESFRPPDLNMHLFGKR